MKRYVITYHLRPDAEDVIVTFSANTEEEAIIFAKQYRKESFSIEEVAREYKYGMKLRGFSPGCQPRYGLVRAEDSDKYWNILVYNRPLTEQEVADYELEEV